MSSEQNWASTTISGLGRDAFAQLVAELLSAEYRNVERIPNLGPLPCFSRWFVPQSMWQLRRRDDSFFGEPDPVGLYVIDHLPMQVLARPSPADIRSPLLEATLSEVHHSDLRECPVFILNNSTLDDRASLQDLLLPTYDETLVSFGLKLSAVGNADSIAQQPETARRLARFLSQYWDGIAVSLERDGPRVDQFIAQSYLPSAVSALQSGPFEPLSQGGGGHRLHVVIKELERLLATSSTERQLEEFLREHYQDIFGFQYDRIETQLWLRLLGADIAERNRRTDLFLRNAVSGDWELVELKRATVRLVGTSRDVPTLASAVHDAIHQIDNYLRLLQQDQIRQQLKRQGIEYFEPIAHLVIGRQPSMSQREWRWLLGNNRSGVNIKSYDCLLRDMKVRLKTLTS